MKENTKEIPLMNEDKFKEYIQNAKIYSQINFTISKVASIYRSIRRNKVTPEGVMIPKRPFNNKANTSKRVSNSRPINVFKKRIYESFRKY